VHCEHVIRVDNASIASEFETAIRDSFRQMSLPAAERVVVRPACIVDPRDFSISGSMHGTSCRSGVPLNCYRT